MKKNTFTLVGVVAIAALLSSCSSTTAAAPSRTSSAPAIDVTLPASMADSGKLTVVTSPGSEPMSFIEAGGTEPTGFDIEIINAVAAKLGLTAEISAEKFPGSVASLTAGRYDVMVGAITDTQEREKELDFVDYLINGTVLVVPKGNPLELTDNESLCGHTFAILKGSGYVATVTDRINPLTCADNPINLLEFPDLSTALLAVTSGRADFTFYDSNTATVLSESTSDIDVIKGDFVPDAYFGFMSMKDNGVAEALAAGLKAVIADGEYAPIAEKWDQTDNIYTDATINGATF